MKLAFIIRKYMTREDCVRIEIKLSLLVQDSIKRLHNKKKKDASEPIEDALQAF
jgi:hypothetical protein